MKEEVEAAVKFIIKLIKKNSKIKDEDLLKFQKRLERLLTKKYENHWHLHDPPKGQAYRCLRLNSNIGKEPSINKAASECGIQYSDLKLPLELTVWIDPEEVCCRFGESKGSYCTVASFKEEKSKSLSDLSDISKLKYDDESSSTISESTTESEDYSSENLSPNMNYFKRQFILTPPATEVDENNNNHQLSPFSPGNFTGFPIYTNDMFHMNSPTSISSYTSCASPPLEQSYLSNIYTNYLHRENAEFNRLSPNSLNKNFWNGVQCNSFPRYQYYVNRRHMTRVQ